MCEVCGRPRKRGAKRFCSSQCYGKWLEGRDGKESNRWRDARWLTPNGYVYMTVRGQNKLEHRVIVERILGRPLRPGEVVHHRNGIKSDNHPDNLVLTSDA